VELFITFLIGYRTDLEIDLTHPSDIVFQQMLVQGMRNLQSVDEHECRYIFTAIRNFDNLAPRVTNLGLGAITLPHFDEEWLFLLAS